MTKAAKVQAAILFLNGGLASSAILPLEILRTVGVFWNILNDLPIDPRFEITTASQDGEPVKIREYKTLAADHSFESLEQPDVVIVPSGGFHIPRTSSEAFGADKALENNAAAVPWLRTWSGGGAHIVGIGSGVGLMAEAGLLDGHQAATHWGVVDDYRERFPAVDWRTEFTVTHSDRTYCSASFTAGTDVVLLLVEALCGPEIAMQTASAHMLDLPKTRHLRWGNAALADTREDETIVRVEDWLRANFATDINFLEVAKNFGMSARTFARHFRSATGESPLAYLQQLRISAASRLLEDTHLNVETVAMRVGYHDLVHFRTLFKRQTGLTPTAYRQRFR